MATTKQLLKQAQQLNEQKKYKEVIELLTDEVLSKAYNAELYAERAQAFYREEQNFRSFTDATISVSIKPNAKAYNYRGNYFLDQQDYNQALVYYNKSIELDPDYLNPYNGRGIVLKQLGKIDEALSDYDKAIRLEPNSPYPYNGRGNVWGDLGRDDKALLDYCHALEIDPTYVSPYFNRGLLYYRQNKYSEAIHDFTTTLRLNPKHEKAQYWVDKIKAQMGEKLPIQENASDSFYLFSNAVHDLPEPQRKNIFDKAVAIYEEIVVKKIRKFACDGIEGNVVHYTKLKTADILVSVDDSHMRYSNAVYMNDPEEGQLILKCLNNNRVEEAFKEGQKEEGNNIYLGSFLPTEFADDLILWRTYGKDDSNIEAAGCSIEIDTSFFDQDRRQDGDSIHPQMRSDAGVDIGKHFLYKVLYYDKKNDKFVNDKDEVFKNALKELGRGLEELLIMKTGDKTIDTAINKIVFYLISEVRYFIKSMGYAFEREVRVIKMAASGSDAVMIEESGSIPRLFIESNKPILKYIRKITLGPKVAHPEQYIYLEAKAKKKGVDIKLQASDEKFQ